MDFQDKVVVVTGSAQGIGREIAREFEQAGAIVCGIDQLPREYFTGNIADKDVLEQFVEQVIRDYSSVDYVIHNAAPLMVGLDEGLYEEFDLALKVSVTAPFYPTKLLKPYFNPGAAIVHITSTRASMSQAQTESYSAAKGALTALTHALAITLAGRVRVNAIAPGWIDTDESILSEADHLQQPVGRVGHPQDIAQLVLYLCSDKASFITGQTFTVDGGMSVQMVYHGDRGWSFKK